MGKKAGEEIDGRTDLYSLGVVLYQMVTARLPFEGDSLYAIMMQHIEGNVRAPDELVPELKIPPVLSKVILKAIDKSRDLRFQNADEFIAALEPGSVENSASAPVGPPVMSASRVSPVSQNRISQLSQTPSQPPSAPSSEISSASSASVILQLPGFTPVAVPAASIPPPLPKSAAQHVFLQQ